MGEIIHTHVSRKVSANVNQLEIIVTKIIPFIPSTFMYTVHIGDRKQILEVIHDQDLLSGFRLTFQPCGDIAGLRFIVQHCELSVAGLER